MTVKIPLILMAITSLLGDVITSNDCILPPRLWCENRVTAETCNVLSLCEQYVWSKQARLPKGNNLVNFTVYIESMCPDCRNFISNQLYPVWSDISTIMNLTIVPYGNAQEKKQGTKWEFMCQHGKEECTGNIIEACTIHLYKDVKQHFPFIHCLEEASVVPREAASKCAKLHGLSYNVIMMCANSSLGNMLEHKMAVLTDQLNPPHMYVPWVELNQVHTEVIQKASEKNLKDLICRSYYDKFGNTPAVCKKLQQ